MDLTPTERFKIKELQNDSVVMGILDRLHKERGSNPLPFAPKSDRLPMEQYEDWVFSSGVTRGVQLVLQTLGYTNER